MTATQIDQRSLEFQVRRISASPPQPEHRNGDGITEVLWEAAADDWVATARRVQQALQRRGVEAHTAEDLLQEVALKILDRGERFNDRAHRERWVYTVAWRLAQNRWRDDRRLLFQPPPDLARGHDPADVVAARETLGRVLDAFGGLSAPEQDAIRQGADPHGQDGATIVRRHRARAKLARVRAALALGLSRVRSQVEQVLEGVGPAVIVGAVTLSPLLGGSEGPAWSPPERLNVAALEPAAPADVPARSASEVATGTTSRVQHKAASKGVGTKNASDAGTTDVLPGPHDPVVHVQPDTEGPRPLACVVGACIDHPARGVLFPE